MARGQTKISNFLSEAMQQVFVFCKTKRKQKLTEEVGELAAKLMTSERADNSTMRSNIIMN